PDSAGGYAMNVEDVYVLSVIPALTLLPASMQSIEAQAMLLAIGLQESGLDDRHQDYGPAHGYWQFEERGGVAGVLRHPLTGSLARDLLNRLDYDSEYVITSELVHVIIEHNDIVAAAFARLLLYTVPERLPGQGEAAMGWQQYLSAWRPGRPHPERWSGYF